MAAPAKPYELTFDERPNYLFVKVTTDDFSVDIALAYLREVILESRELDYSRILIVRQIPSVLSPEKNTLVSSRLAELAFEGLKIAVVEPKLDSDQQASFSAATSSGLGIDVQAFMSVPDARLWLLDD